MRGNFILFGLLLTNGAGRSDLGLNILFGGTIVLNKVQGCFGPGGLRAPCVLACAMRSLAIVFTIVQSFGPGGLRAPCVLACAMRSLAIVFPIVQSLLFFFFFFFFPPFFVFYPLWGSSHVRNNLSPNILA